MQDARLEAVGLVAEITALAVMVNTFTDYCVFVRFYGHTLNFEVELAASKKDYNNTAVKGESHLPGGWLEEDQALRSLKKLKFQLKKILREKQIDYSKLNYDIEEVRHYRLT